MGLRDWLARRRAKKESSTSSSTSGLVSEGGMSIDIKQVTGTTPSKTYTQITSPTKTTSRTSSRTSTSSTSTSTKPEVEYVDLYAPIESFDVTPGADGTTYTKKPGTATYERTPSTSPSAAPTYTPVEIKKPTQSLVQQVKVPTSAELYREQQEKLRKDETIYIRDSGGVTKGTTTYIGQAVVPGTEGKTANQIRQELAQEYKKETGTYVSPTRLRGSVRYEEVLVKSEPGEQIYFEDLPKQKEETKTFSFFNYQKEVPVSDIKSIFSYVPLQVQTIAEATGKGVSNVVYKLDKGSIGKEITYYEPQFGTIGEFGATREIKQIYSEQDRQDFAKTIGSVTTGVTRTGVYFLPGIGGAVFGTEVAELGTDIYRTKKAGEKLTSQQKLELGITGGILLTAGALKSAQYLKAPITKSTESGFKITTRADEFLGKRVKIGEGKMSVLPSQRGTYVEYVKIKKPKVDVKASEVIGYDKGKSVIYPKQKLSQTSFEGQRTVVKEFKKGKEKILYSGIPYKEASKYKEQLNYFKDLFGENTARNILRYKQPKFKEFVLEKSKVEIIDNKAFGSFKYTEKQPKIVVDKNLGIKTRIGKDTKTYYEFERFGKSNEKVGIGVELGVEGKIKPRKITSIDLIGRKGVDISLSKEPIKISKDIQIQKIESISFTEQIPFNKILSVDKSRTTLLSPAESGSGITIIKSNGVKSSKQFLDSLSQQELKLAPVLKKIPKQTPKKTSSIKLELETPTKSESIWAGKGIYEKTEEISYFPLKQNTMNIQQQNILKVKEPQLQTAQQIQILDLKTALRKVTPQRLKTDTKLKQELRQEMKQVQEQKLVQQTKLKTKLNLLKRQTQLQRQKNLYKIEQTRVTPRRPTEIKVPFKIKDSFTQRLAKKSDEEFEVFVKDVGLIAKTKKKKEATDILEEYLGKTLKATGFVTFGGKKIKAKELGLGMAFRPGKSDPFKVVEKKSKRLRKGGTGKQIQFFR